MRWSIEIVPIELNPNRMCKFCMMPASFTLIETNEQDMKELRVNYLCSGHAEMAEDFTEDNFPNIMSLIENTFDGEYNS